MESTQRVQRNDFRKQVKEEWAMLWHERVDDKVRAEGIAMHEYPLLFMDKGYIVFATRDAKSPSLAEIFDYWSVQGKIYAPNPATGGWGKFIRTHVKSTRVRSSTYENENRKSDRKKQQLKKGGRGWLHT